jgi:hypothetical protein
MTATIQIVLWLCQRDKIVMLQPEGKISPPMHSGGCDRFYRGELQIVAVDQEGSQRGRWAQPGIINI